MASFHLLTLLPPPLLALAAAHLPLASLLCLQRCSSTLRAFRAHEQYMTGAWRGIRLSLEHDTHCRLILQACPYLQHLRLYINTRTRAKPSHEYTLARVPHLRSLTLFPNDSSKRESRHANAQPRVRFAFGRLLYSLPNLASLYCVNLRTCVRDLLDIPSHSTLEELHIEATGRSCWTRSGWKQRRCCFHSERGAEAAGAGRCSHDTPSEAEAARTQKAPYAHRDPTVPAKSVQSLDDTAQRMHTALTRTQPTRRSCETRLALADWLHGRLSRDGPPVDESLQLDWLLRH